MSTLGKPNYMPGIGRHVFDWNGTGVRIEISRVDDEGVGEICIFGGKEASELLHLSKINLLSTRGCAEVARRVAERQPFDWDDALVYVAALTMRKLREGEPVYEVGKRPQSMKREYLLHPILPLNQPTTIYAAGGSIKSALASYIACLVQYQIASPLGWTPLQGNVLYLDWEADHATHERRVWAIKQGLEIPEEVTFLYQPCSRSLIDQLDDIARQVGDYNISLVIIDSATGALATSRRYSSDPSESVSQYYNALRFLGCTSLTIDHVAKHRLDTPESSGPYGSVVKTNRARSQFEIECEQEKGSQVAYLKMKHTKVNDGMRLQDIGIEVVYANDEYGNAERIDFNPINVNDIARFAEKLTDKEQARNVLARKPMTATDLIVEMGIDDTKKSHTVMAMLNKNKNKRGGFVLLDTGEWQNL